MTIITKVPSVYSLYKGKRRGLLSIYVYGILLLLFTSSLTKVFVHTEFAV